MTITQKHENLASRIKEIQEHRNALIALCKKTSDEFQINHHWLLKPVFTRNYSLNHISKWWTTVGKKVFAKWQHEEMYVSAVSKLSVNELKILKISRHYRE
jgi:hypothetical protein